MLLQFMEFLKNDLKKKIRRSKSSASKVSRGLWYRGGDCATCSTIYTDDTIEDLNFTFRNRVIYKHLF